LPSYSFQFRKADHIDPRGGADLHVHVFYNQGKSRRLLGRYRIPTLEPVFPGERELNRTEEGLLRSWLSQPEQVRKLQSALDSTLFDMHKVAGLANRFADITAEQGETYLVIRVPVARRLE
jgi:hypothetical protein